jgi:EmrB/QacA subfamily drug resistance transporter
VPFPSAEPAADPRKWAVLAAVGVGTFMSALDASIVNVLLPVMGDALGATVAGIEWVVTVYLLVVSGVLLIVGRLGDLRGHKDVYVLGFAGFVVSSALCGLAGSLHALVAFRAVQALSAAMLFANAPAILTQSFPPSERGKALGMQATMTYLGLTVGPPLGGFLATVLGWRSIFFVNVPVGALGVWLSLRSVARDRPAGATPRFDVPGAALFFFGLLSLLLALNQGHAWGWAAPATLGLVAAAALLLGAFVAVERRRPEPMLDLSLFRSPVFSGAVFSATLTYVAQFALLFLLPFYLMQARGLAPDAAGRLLVAQPLVMAVTAPLAGTLSDRLGSRGPIVLGLLALAAGLVLLSFVGPQTPLWRVAAGLAVCGLGFGAFVAPNNSRLLGAAPPNRRGIASGVLAAARNVGMVLGVGLAGAVYTTVVGAGGAAAIPRAVSVAAWILTGVILLAAATSWLEGRPAPGTSVDRA